MTSPSPAECGVCHEDFNEENRRPRLLNCSHYFCSECICKLIANQRKICPICRIPFSANSTKDLNTSYAALDFMRYFSLLDSTSSTLSDDIKETEESSDDLLRAIQEAKTTMQVTLKDVSSLEQKYRKEVRALEDHIIPQIRDINVRGNRRLVELEGADNRLEYQILEMHEKETQLKEKKEKLDEAKSPQETAASLEIVKDTSLSLLKSVNLVMEQLQGTKEMINEGQKEIEVIQRVTTKLNEGLSRAIFADDGDSSVSLQLIANQKLPEQISAHDLQNLNPVVRTWVEEGKVYAIQEKLGIRRSARLSVSGSNLFIHHLVDEPTPEEVITVEHSELLKFLANTPKQVFMDLNVAGSSIGRMQIALGPNQAAKQFMLLCSGETGQSYAKTKLLHLHRDNTREYVICGDYEKNNGIGGKALVSGLQPGSNYVSPELDGTLRGLYWDSNVESRGAQFAIYTKGNQEKILNTAFGKVVEGLDTLKGAVQSQSDVRKIMIKNCGVVFPCMLIV